MEHLQDHKINRYIFLGAILVFAGFLLYSLTAFFTAFLGAIMFYVLSKSPVDWLVNRKKWRKSWAAALVIITSFFIILLPVSLLAGMMYQKVSLVATNFSTIIEPLTHIDEVLRKKFDFILLSEKNIAQLQTFATDFVSTALNQGMNLFSSMIMMYFFLYFMIMNTGRMEAAIVFYLPFKRSQIALFGTELHAQTISNAVGVPLIAVVQGAVAYISFLITGMEEPVFWAIITGFASIIPIVGTGIVWLPMGIYMLIIGQTWQGIFLFGWGSIILSTMDNVVRFLLARKMADVHPIVTVLGVIIGLHYFGITGLIFGPLLISYFIILIRIYYQEYQPQKRPKKKTVAQSFNLPFLRRRNL
ncbi:AI-2E family transporter [Sediminibacterium sp.]|uniref:AI-2E family transporter n=1 Tax=Sediminibacterium sp. TaxID=1917865 RepID=UPI003F6EC406